MGQYMAVARAAQMLGMGRHELQRLIRRGELDTFEGQVDIEALKRRFPQLTLDDDPVLERLAHIRATAFSRRVRSEVAPERDELESRLKRRDTELSVQQARANHLDAVLHELGRLLADLQDGADAGQRELIQRIGGWLRERLHRDR